MRGRGILTAIVVALIAQGVGAQRVRLKPDTTHRVGAQKRLDNVATRQAILLAEDRRAPSPRDLATIRAGLRSKDADTVRIAVRALGRLERPNLIPDILPQLKSPWAEVRAEAANAVGQAAQGWKEAPARRSAAVRVTGSVRTLNATGVESAAAVAATLVARLRAEDEPSVRAALCQTIGRLPYTAAAQVQAASAALTDALAHDDTVEGRLGVAQGFESLIRLHHRLGAASPDAIALLKRLAATDGRDPAAGARIRRLALQALASTDAGDDDALITAASHDRDAQVRRLAMRLVRSPMLPLLKQGLADSSPMVRLEALLGMRMRGGGDVCPASLAALHDRDPHIALLALDQLAACGIDPEVMAALEHAVTDLSEAASPRGWHRAAHALVALAIAAPGRAAAALPQFVASRFWQLRMYAARAAASMKDRDTLENLARDTDDNVCETAIDGLSKLARHDADAIYIAALGRHGYQAIRAAARALGDAPRAHATAAPALETALRRLIAEGRDNSRDARVAIIEALQALGEPVRPLKPVGETTIASTFDAADVRRFASARARITIRGVGAFELALFTTEAPASVARFARLAESGYYNGLTFHRVVPNFVIQGGSPGASEYVGDAAFMRDEVGLWPHVRGAVGISTRGRDTGDAQIFIDLVDNPRLDHDYTVFAQVLTGMEVVDAILEGDVIEKVEIVS
jgi:cyclophilin family peptidyl-prolyl cis-trans isomerase